MTVPLIDIAPFTARRGGGDDTGRRRVAAAVDEACREVGFLRVVGHGIPTSQIDAALERAHEFFDLSLDRRMRVAMPEAGYPYGYSPLNAEALARSIGDAGPVDLKETYNIGPVDPPPRPLSSMDDPDERAVYAPNLWPDDDLATFRPTFEAYYRSMADLATRLMELFAVALGLPDRYFAGFVDRHGSALRLAHYPAVGQRRLPGQLRAGAHTDYGTLTILATDGRPGLQVLDPAGGWVDVAHADGALVVNLGDLLARWTNDRWRSTMHRVVVSEGDASVNRLSIPFFHNANWDARIECIADGDEAPRYDPVLAGRHLMSKFRSTVGARTSGRAVGRER